ncbi:phage major capsid protein [Micromonospora sp. WMMA1363]|uniref:phage major capsid protein n=1 Tax=Micromonospora sp. WMMA1363 TaxID=3053985 RepID=UPI00259D1E5E|nr:phage major capsid protein [Micromonospora sp. WMMA1363]MDM4722766.1 phage major capsid protein [Micromonospora sp. WMMA1363]
MARKQSEALAEEMEILRSEIKVIEDSEEPTDDELARAEALLVEWDTKKADYDKAIDREAKVAEVMRAALKPANVEEGSAPDARRRGPEVMRKVDPYESLNQEELVRSLWGHGPFNSTDAISRADAAIERAPRHVDDRAKERLTGLVHLDNRHAPLIARHMLLTGSPEYHEQFREYVASRGTYVGEALRAAMSLTDANGGYLVPFTLDPTIILTNAGIAGPLRSISTIKTIATDTWNGVTSAGVSAEWTAEGVEAADASPTLAQPTITPKKADAWVFGSYEVLADSGFAAELGRLLADAKVRLEEAAFATANTGATIPRGVVAAVAAVTASIVTSLTTNAFVVGDVYNTSDALRARDASQASWIANKKIFSLIRQFDTSGGSAFWANLGMGVPNQLLGQPQYECSTMTSVVSTGANILLAGNFAEYYIVDRVGMSVIYDPMVKSTGNGRPTGQGGWYSFWRVGADVVDASAFRLLQLNEVAAATALG